MNIARSFVELATPEPDSGTGRPTQPKPADQISVTARRSTAHGARFDTRSLRRRARLRGWKLPITDGPFAESKEL